MDFSQDDDDEYVGGGGSKSSGYIRMLIGKKTENRSLNGRVYGRTPAPPFAIRKVENPSKNLKLYSKYARHLKRHPSQAPPHWSVGVGMGFSMDDQSASDSDSESDYDSDSSGEMSKKKRDDRVIPHPALVFVRR